MAEKRGLVEARITIFQARIFSDQARYTRPWAKMKSGSFPTLPLSTLSLRSSMTSTIHTLRRFGGS